MIGIVGKTGWLVPAKLFILFTWLLKSSAVRSHFGEYYMGPNIFSPVRDLSIYLFPKFYCQQFSNYVLPCPWPLIHSIGQSPWISILSHVWPFLFLAKLKTTCTAQNSAHWEDFSYPPSFTNDPQMRCSVIAIHFLGYLHIKTCKNICK